MHDFAGGEAASRQPRERDLNAYTKHSAYHTNNKEEHPNYGNIVQYAPAWSQGFQPNRVLLYVMPESVRACHHRIVASTGYYSRCVFEKCSSPPFYPNPLPAAQGKVSEAEPLYERSLSIREKVLGPENPVVARSLDELAGMCAQQARITASTGVFGRHSSTHLVRIGTSEYPMVLQSTPGPNPHHDTMGSALMRRCLSRRAKSTTVIFGGRGG